jgi:curved DNA-binding protein CbpA
VTPDYYAALGLSPTSEDVVIRAAYLALIRRYHPDGNQSEEAAARTLAITAAYDVLSDPDKRAEYDKTRAEEPWEPGPAQGPPSTARRGLFPAAAMMLVLVLVLLVVWSPLPLAEPPAPRPHAPTRAAPVRVDTPPAPPSRRPAQARPAPSPAPPFPEVVQPAGRQPVAAQPSRQPPTAAQPKASAPRDSPITNRNLANLDRLQALHYSQSLSFADGRKKALLVSTRKRFVARRAACLSEACTRETYLARMREISAIMTTP